MNAHTPAPTLLTPSTAPCYVRSRGLADDEPLTAEVMSGGVSNVVLLVEGRRIRVVVKQALARLRVADDWFADPSRAQAEAAALALTGQITPGDVPVLLDNDPEHFSLTISAAPPDWTTWKQQIMTGNVDSCVASWLGRTLRSWHHTTHQQILAPQLEGVEAFRQLRIDPYLRTSARRRPDLAPALEYYAGELLRRRRCLISGDFSPKNVLVSVPLDAACPGWVIDLEVAHRGDPAFDVAFLASHLLLKAVHLPAHRTALRRCLDAFLTAYGPDLGADDQTHLWGLVGCLLLARVIGSSPVDYLSDEQAARVQSAAATILHRPPAELDSLWHTTVTAA